MKKSAIRSSFPKSVKVAGTNYPILMNPELKSTPEMDCIGCFSRETGIQLDPILFDHADAGAVVANTLLHEITHALIYHYSAAMTNFSVRKVSFNEEDMCEIVGNGFQQVFRDNRKLVKWLANYA